MTQELAEFIIKSIVSQPAAVTMQAGERNGKNVLKITVSQRDTARVMGSRGLVIRAIRTLILAQPSTFEDVVIEPITVE